MVADEALLAKLLKGALAQLVERLLCKQDVIGSNPLGSTRCFKHELECLVIISSLHPVA